MIIATHDQQASPSALLLQSRQQAVQHCLSCDVRQAVQHWMHVGMMVCKLTRQHAAKGQRFVPWDSKPQTRSNKILPGNQPTHEGWPSMQPWPHLLSSIAHVVSKTSCLCGALRPCRRNTDAKSDDLCRNNNISLALCHFVNKTSHIVYAFFQVTTEIPKRS